MSLTISGVITIILSQILPMEEVSPFVDSAVVVIGIAITWYGRYRAGGITWWGGKK